MLMIFARLRGIAVADVSFEAEKWINRMGILMLDKLDCLVFSYFLDFVLISMVQ